MSRIRLDQLSINLLLHIIELVGATDRKTLQSLALVNKRLRTVSSTILFRKLTVEKNASNRSIERLTTLSSDLLDKITHLTIEYDKEANISTVMDTRLIEISFSNTPKCYLNKRHGPAHKEDQSDGHQIWLVLGHFIKYRLPKLHLITFNCPEQFPSCILDVLERDRSDCGLHVNTFHLPSLATPKLDPYEVRLATSPNLRGIYFGLHYYPDHQLRYMFSVLQAMASGLAPNLQRVCTGRLDDALSAGIFDLPEVYVPAISFREMVLAQLPKEQRLKAQQDGRLRTLEIENHQEYFGNGLSDWAEVTDLSAIQCLVMDGGTVNTVELAVMTEKYMFSSLQKLMWVIESHDVCHLPSKELWKWSNAMCKFIRKLPALVEIRLQAALTNDILISILDCHGQSLKRLSLSSSYHAHRMIIGPEEAIAIRDICLQLEYLRLTVTRSRGDAAELAIYKALGAIPRLDELHLTIDASYIPPFDLDEDSGDYFPDTPLPDNSSFTEFEQEIYSYEDKTGFNDNVRSARIGHICNALMNGALDESLARAIFTRLSNAKPDGGLPLERLHLTSFGACHFDYKGETTPMGLETVIHEISRSWWLERNPRDDERQNIMATDVTPEMPRTQPRNRERVPTQLLQVIWPQIDVDDLNWRRGWHSLALSDEKL